MVKRCGECAYCLSQSENIGMCDLSMQRTGCGNLVKKDREECIDFIDTEGFIIVGRGW